MRAGWAAPLLLLIVCAAFPWAAVDAQASTSHAPAALAAEVIPSLLPADSGRYPALVVSLVDSRGGPTLSLIPLTVYVSSSNASVASVPASVTLPAGAAFVQVPVSTSRAPGTSTLAAAVNGMASAKVELRTVPLASGAASLSLSVSPARTVTALSGADEAFAVQLVNAAGAPSASVSQTSLMITANDSVLGGPISVTLPAGTDIAYGTFKAVEPGGATLTAIAPALATGTAKLKVAPVAAALTVASDPSEVAPGEGASLTVSVSVLGMPVQGENVTLSVSAGELLPPGPVTTGQDGQSTVEFVPSGPGVVTVTASASSQLFGQLSGSTTVVVAQPTSATTSPSSVLGAIGAYVPVIATVVVVGVAFALVRATLKRRRGRVEDEFEGSEGKPQG